MKWHQVGQQIANLVKKEYELRYGNNISELGLASAKSNI